jgi:hypothetical protein
VPGEASDRAQPNAAETRVWEEYTSLLDFVGRCVQAVEEDSWRYLSDKLAEVRSVAQRLERLLDDRETVRELRPGALRQLLRWRHTQRYRAGRLLHPVPGKMSEQDLQAVALQVGFPHVDPKRVVSLLADARALAERADVEYAQAVRVLASLRSYEYAP